MVFFRVGFGLMVVWKAAICIISDSYHIVNILKCMCSQNKVIHSFIQVYSWVARVQVALCMIAFKLC